jgi:hemerythrin
MFAATSGSLPQFHRSLNQRREIGSWIAQLLWGGAMRTSTKVFEPSTFDLHKLDEEHAEIRRRYTGLEQAILHGQGLSGILDAANSFEQMMLLHFIHEERFLERLSLSSLQRHRDANIEITAQLFDIEVGLEQHKVAAVFQLLLLGRVWIREHMGLESEEFQSEDLIEVGRPFLVPPPSVSRPLYPA